MIKVVHLAAAPEFARLIMRHEIVQMGPGYEHVIIASPGLDLDALEADGFTVERLPIARKLAPVSDMASVVRLVVLLRRLKPELLHTYTPKAGLLGQLAGAISGVRPRVHGCRGLLYASGMPGWRRRLFQITDWITCQLADRVAFVSETDRDQLVNGGQCPAWKARVTGNGVDLSLFRRSADYQVERRATREEFGFADDTTVILTVGRFVADKGYADLAQAIPQLRGSAGRLRFLWVAPVLAGEGEALDERLYQAGPLQGIVTRLERRDDLRRLYQAADLLLHPSHREGVPRVLMEAAVNGLPIVASTIPGNRQVVDFGRTAFGFEAGNPASLAEALDEALTDRPRCLRQAEAAATDVSERMDVAQVAKRIASVYRELRPGPLPTIPRWKRLI